MFFNGRSRWWRIGRTCAGRIILYVVRAGIGIIVYARVANVQGWRHLVHVAAIVTAIAIIIVIIIGTITTICHRY